MILTVLSLFLLPLAHFGLASSVSRRADVETCVETTSANAFSNPSWEDGTAGWEYNCTFSVCENGTVLLYGVDQFA